MTRHEIMISGFGGQGIALTGKLIAAAATAEGRNAVWTPSYGPEMRGGESNCTVVMTDDPVGSPVAAQPDTVIVMDRPSLGKLQKVVNSGGLMMINSSLVAARPRFRRVRVCRVPVTHLAEEVGDPRVANIVMLGAFIEADGAVSAEAVRRALHDWLARRPQLLAINERALERGMRFVREER